MVLVTQPLIRIVELADNLKNIPVKYFEPNHIEQ